MSDDARGSVPMSPPPAPMPRQQTLSGESAEQQRDRYRAELATLRPLAVRVEELERIVGRPPNPLAKGDVGTALAGRSFEIEERLDTLTVAVTALTESIDADRREREAQRAAAKAGADAVIERRREQPAKTGWAVLTAVLCFVAVGAVGSVGAYIALHWRSDAPALPAPPQASERSR